ncbi:carboxypeptidase-like regulatory domain-containing protein [Longimicrobium sp.]|uniref:carboxypeptidase-like regulatory domain-containing protein n=1 Tax=Longimicrobium sp. TaxID=2029185 RepID=UPI002E35C781|nr:carboxypeptidase-like regulatory domain-containing protein [Longimicrobium sp.]HEX6042778.1 carboxypeptidase-like regulatory domain-containing protein [Longimicrobium sp.]
MMNAAAVVRRGLRVLGVVAGLVLGGAGPLWGQDARVLGRVTDGVGNPVAEARVTLVPQGAAEGARETVSGNTGGFQFAGVAPGTYTLRATRDGYTVQERRVTVRPGQVTSQVVRLQRGRAARDVSNALRPIGR